MPRPQLWTRGSWDDGAGGQALLRGPCSPGMVLGFRGTIQGNLVQGNHPGKPGSGEPPGKPGSLQVSGEHGTFKSSLTNKHPNRPNPCPNYRPDCPPSKTPGASCAMKGMAETLTL